MIGIEVIAAKGLLAVMKSGYLKYLAAKFVNLVAAHGVAFTVHSTLVVGTVIGGVVITAELMNLLEGFVRELSSGKLHSASVKLLLFIHKAQIGFDAAENIIDSYIENSDLEYDSKKVIKAAYKELLAEARKRSGDVTQSRLLINSNFGNCSECDGEGSIDCYTCDGTAFVECDECYAEGTIECAVCNQGEVQHGKCNGEGCQWCRYRGWVKCPRCRGNYDIRCKECRGGALIRCPDCENGFFPCSECDGTGHVDEECDECNGEGQVFCPECDGDLNIECEDCNGDGTIDCDECDGYGEIEHLLCDGLGCQWCRQSGLVKCPTCRGKSTRRCEDCYGRGTVKCIECNSGYVECIICDGDGYI